MHIFFSVGEPSGDQHAAQLIAELRRKAPGLRVTGFGGPLMKEQGAALLYPLTDLAVMGFLRVIPLLWTFYKLIREAEAHLIRDRPEAVVLIDAPGFNWWIARKAKKQGIPVFYFLPPQMWAWGPWRVGKVRRFVDHVISGLSFEVEWYKQRGINCEFVGHPFFDEVARHPLDREFMASLCPADHPLIGLLPGSRVHEVRSNFPVMLQVMRRLHTEHPHAQFRVACYKELHREMCQETLQEAIQRDATFEHIPLQLCVERTPEIIAASDCCLIVSGSVSLELLARRTPAVVLYYGNWRLMLLRWIFMTCKYVTLPNLMADREIMPEFVFRGSVDKPVRQMASILNDWLSSQPKRQQTVGELDRLAAEVARPGGIARTADYIIEQLRPASQSHAAAA